MQFTKLIIALFAGIALAAPSPATAELEARQDTRCNLCRDDCFFSKGSNADFERCKGRCNSDLGCNV